ncbi:hypothetical protein AMATHDRAFT_48249 [Amanita thiersii Skay4041]|uniref:Uncharacterized protein n=1 Tax=Amanita thiersii Skay4041 TaxID=703135 RepID=A0A2A9NQM2_9AGAR|nr:hypothetical protein AMATHDRAFT_48249 [Amanita thiersii Skay4041]
MGIQFTTPNEHRDIMGLDIYANLTRIYKHIIRKLSVTVTLQTIHSTFNARLSTRDSDRDLKIKPLLRSFLRDRQRLDIGIIKFSEADSWINLHMNVKWKIVAFNRAGCLRLQIV